MPSENQFFLNEGAIGHQSVLGGWTHLGGPVGHRTQNVHFSTLLQQLRGYLALTDLIKNQSIGGPQGTLHTLI